MLDNNISVLSPAFERNNVPVVMAVNNLYAPYAGVTIQSLLDHANEESNYDIIIFQRDISGENKRLLKSLAAGHTNVSIRFFDPSPLFTSFGFNYNNGVHSCPVEVVYKVIAPHILNYPGRIIVVDVDTMLKTDIARLIGEDLEGCGVGGVRDMILNGWYSYDITMSSGKVRVRDYFQNVCGLDDLKDYVNTGLLLFDRDKYVRELGMETILDTVQRGGYLMPEQDALNILQKGRIKGLDPAWNVIVLSTPSRKKYFDAASKLFGEACERAYENPYLLHWAGKPGPWVCPDVPWGSEWWQTALRTPFVGHIIARMPDEREKRRAYFRKRYGKEVDDIWAPLPKEIEKDGQI